MSKGSHRRPSSVPMEEVDRNWDRIFGDKDKQKDSAESTKNVGDTQQEQYNSNTH